MRFICATCGSEGGAGRSSGNLASTGGPKRESMRESGNAKILCLEV